MVRTPLMSFGARFALRIASVALLSLLAANVALAAPAAPCAQQVRVKHTAQTTTIRKVMRRLKALSTRGVRMPRARAGLLFDFRPHLHRAGATHTDDESDAIQSDGPITIVHVADRHGFGLRPLGIVASPTVRRCTTLAFSPRSPRGPPPTV